jgi:hypothetical protein
MVIDIILKRMSNNLKKKNNKILIKDVNNDLVKDVNNDLVKEKKVSIHNIVSVVLIPDINEYINANLKDEIWWSDEDYLLFRKNLINDIKNNKKSY